MADSLTVREAFQAMRAYLEAYWERNERSGELAQVLSDTAWLDDGMTTDPAAWTDWLIAVASVQPEPKGN